MTVSTPKPPVGCVSQPKAVDGYLKEFDERFGFLYKIIEKYAIPEPRTTELQVNWGEEIKSFLKSSIERARREGVEAGRKEMDKEWSKVNKYERQRVVEMIERMYPYEEIEKFKGMDYLEIVQEVKSDLQSKLKEDK